MESIIIKGNENLIRRIKRHYDSQKLESDTFDFVAKTITCTITILNDEICFQGDDASKHARIWSNDTLEKDSNNLHVSTSTMGQADLFGPLVAIATYMDEESIRYMNSLEIPDSLSTKDIIEFTKKIASKIKYTSTIIDNTHYNKLSNTITKNGIRARMINDVIVKMVKETGTTTIPYYIEDTFVLKTYLNYLSDVPSRYKHVLVNPDMHKDAGYTAANILARYTYLSYLSKMQKALKIKLPLGNTGNTINTAVEIGKKYGEETLNKVIKLNLTNIKTLKSKINA